MTILKLPDEILLEIFKPLFIPPYPTPLSSNAAPKRQVADGAALPKVSRRFYRLSTPAFYTHLNLDFETCPQTAVLLHRTLLENPELRSYCRSLRLTLPDPDAIEPASGTGHYYDEGRDAERGTEKRLSLETCMEIATDLVTWMTNTRDLCVIGYFTHPQTEAGTWSLVHTATQRMPQLEKLSLGKQVWLERVCNLLSSLSNSEPKQQPQLRILEIGIGVIGTWDQGGGGVDFNRIMTLPEAEQIGSSPITSVSIDYLLARPENLGRLLLLPTKLEHFAFKGMSPGCYFSWPLVSLVSALESQKTSLRTVQVASGSPTDVDMPIRSAEDQVKDLPEDLAWFKKLAGLTFTTPPP